jgi:hypothetical protein
MKIEDVKVGMKVFVTQDNPWNSLFKKGDETVVQEVDYTTGYVRLRSNIKYTVGPDHIEQVGDEKSPSKETTYNSVLTRRDLFAAAAMLGLIITEYNGDNSIAEQAARHADDLIKVLDTK